MLLYIQGKEHGKYLLDSVLNGPFQYGMLEVPGTPTSSVSTRPRTYDDLTDKEKIREECDIRATNIILQGLPPDVYTLLYNEFDRFTSDKGETIHAYYLRFAQLINDMDTIGMTMKKLQVNTKFVNNLQPEWSKFVTDIKLAKDMHESSFDQLYVYLRQHEVHANEVRTMKETFPNPLALVANSYNTPPYYNNHQPYDDPIASINKAMAFISTDFVSRYPSTNNQLRTYSNPRNQATIQDGRVTVQNVQGRQSQGYVGSGAKGNAIETRANGNMRNSTANQTKVIRCYNCMGEVHITRHCTQPNRPKNSEWFKEKMLFAQALESGITLDEEALAFLTDLRDKVESGLDTQTLPTTAIF
ncbi:hypothetical protein Tco_1252680 [Tanacetum coccineum]